MWVLDYKETETWQTDTFELWCWRRLLRVPWTARRSNQSILKEISLEYSLKGLMLKLRVQYFATWCKELTHWKRPWCLERFKAGREGNSRGWDGWMTSLTQWIWVLVSSGSWWWTRRPAELLSMESQRAGHDWEWLNWIEVNWMEWNTLKSQSSFEKEEQNTVLHTLISNYIIKP